MKYPVKRLFKCKITKQIYKPGDEYATKDTARAEFLAERGFISRVTGKPVKVETPPIPEPVKEAVLEPFQEPEAPESTPEPEAPEPEAEPEPKPRHVGAGIYELPDGRRVKGKDAAYAAMEEGE